MLIVFPFTHKDDALAVKLMRWMIDLGSLQDHQILLAYDHRAKTDDQIREMAGKAFGHLYEVVIKEDVYDSWPQSPNLIFRKAAKLIEYEIKAPYWLWLEADCVPMKKGWLETLEREHLEKKQPFTGGFVDVPNVPPHMSGVGIYPGRMTHFAGTAVMGIEEPAWDVAAAPQIITQMNKTELIVHAWQHEAFKDKSELDNLRKQHPRMVLFHSDKHYSLIPLLREEMQPKRMARNDESGERLKCLIEGCQNPIHSRAVCRMHYARKERNGNYELPPRATVKEKLLANRQIAESGCWLWTGGSFNSGYGEIAVPLDDGTCYQTVVHRVAYETFVGPIPEQMHVCHKCDVRNCFNPEHLFLGTDADNMRDAGEKGRLPYGETHPWSKLTDAQVEEIKKRYAKGESQAKLATEFNCSQSNICAIVNGKTRKLSGGLNAGTKGAVRDSCLPSPLKDSTCDLFIKTYPPDYEWLGYCLASILHFAKDFRQTLIAYEGSEPPFEQRILFSDGTSKVKKEAFKTLNVGTNPQGYLWQQVIKLYADIYTDADYLCFTDSDTVFTREITPETYFSNGKIVWMMTPYEKTATPWQPIVEKFLKKPVAFEFMRRLPFLIPRWLLSELRVFCEREHGVQLDSYVLNQGDRGFSEFNALGAFAYEYYRDAFVWVNTEEVAPEDWPSLTVHQSWSKKALTAEDKKMYDEILGGGVPPGGTPARETPSPPDTYHPKASLDTYPGEGAAKQSGTVPSTLCEVGIGGNDSPTTAKGDRTSLLGIHQTKEGWWVLDGDTHISKWVEDDGKLAHDQWLLSRILPYVPEGGVVVEAGAYIGNHTIAFLDKVGPNGKVYSFEPHFRARECLQQNCPGAEIYRFALWNNYGQLKLEENKSNPGASYLTKGEGTPAMPLDSLKALKNRFDFFIIDVEGTELEVLKGAEKLIEKHHPVLVVEINAGALRRHGVSAQELTSWIKAHGYPIIRPIQNLLIADAPIYDVLCLAEKSELDFYLEALAKHFTSPLAKGRIIKKLKGEPLKTLP